MKKLVLSCALLLLLAACAPVQHAPAPAATVTPPAPASAARTANSPNNLATLSYPEGWQLIKSGNPNYVMAGDYPLGENESAPPVDTKAHFVALAAQTDNNATGFTRDQLINLARGDLGPTCGNAAVLNRAEDVVIDGRQGVWVYCKGKAEGRDVQASVAYAARGNTLAAAFTLAYDDAPWEELKPMYRNIIAAVKFTGAAGE